MPAMTERTADAAPFLVHLTGAGEGTRRPLTEDKLQIGISPEADIHFPAREHAVGFRHARMRRVDRRSYEIVAEPGRLLRVNGRTVERHVLVPGDVVELGDGGPLLRFETAGAWRQGRGGRSLRASVAAALRNTAERAGREASGRAGRAAAFVRTLPGELHAALSGRSKALVALSVVVLLTLMSLLVVRTWTLEQRLADETLRFREIGELLQRSEDRQLTQGELERLRTAVEDGLAGRVDALEARSQAVQTVIARAMPSVVFLQGAYGFLEPDTRTPLRLVTDDQGRTVRDSRGNPSVTAGGNGPLFERLYTGTGFVVTEEGLLLTNRHVALPWESDDPARQLSQRGYIPIMTRMVAYLPYREEPFDVELVAASGTADVAVLRAPSIAGEVTPLPLAERSPRPGEEIVVMGFPTGTRALLARSDPRFMDDLTHEQRLDVWALARRLSEGGYIAPLSTRGIVGQVTPVRVVYDAETTRGGSGGPVLGLDGQVVAVNMAIMPEFGGSNLGIPVEEAWRLLDLVLTAEATVDEEDGEVPVLQTW